LIEEAMKGSNGFIELRKIEAAKDVAETLAKSRNIIYLPKGANILMSMPGVSTQSQSQQ
jgi:prohibitin 1